jgi:hypothetical protein
VVPTAGARWTPFLHVVALPTTVFTTPEDKETKRTRAAAASAKNKPLLLSAMARGEQASAEVAAPPSPLGPFRTHAKGA